MLYQKKEKTIKLGRQSITFETGRLAKQADGAVLVTCEGTQVLVTVCSSRVMKDGQDFFPLTVDYFEKFYAAGKFLGGYMKREAKPTNPEVLNARLIDRPLRPLFPAGYMFETYLQATVLSYDENANPEILASLGAAACLAISDVPFNGPLGTVKMGRIDGKFIINPTKKEQEISDFEMVVSATPKAILMVEGEASELSEEDMLTALSLAHEEIKKYCSELTSFVSEFGVPKRAFEAVAPNKTFVEKINAKWGKNILSCLDISDKLARGKALFELELKIKEDMAANFKDYGVEENASFGKITHTGVEDVLYEVMRTRILKEGKRIAGRKLDQVRPIMTETNLLKTPHGSALFTRGETQVLGVVTIGSSQGDQTVDRIVGLSHDKFYLHYAFPPFSVGEAKGLFRVGRRELGHGNLAERAVKKVLPKYEDFGYTMRVNCEVLESNGSSSMGSVCAASMALMDAGVPLKAPVAGIAMGLIKEGDDFSILSDILGDEDHLGDMDFKVAGTKDGITAIQMDIKIEGITLDIVKKALAQAKEGRIHILGEMSKSITSHRKEFKDNVPRYLSLFVGSDKLGMVIGPGGKHIKATQEMFGVVVECVEDGTVKVIGIDPKVLEKAVAHIDLQVNGPKIGGDYNGVVVTIKEYGAFVDIAPNVSGLVHISELSNERVENVNDYLNEGDTIKVRVVEVDKFGRIKLSAKVVESIPRKK